MDKWIETDGGSYRIERLGGSIRLNVQNDEELDSCELSPLDALALARTLIQFAEEAW